MSRTLRTISMLDELGVTGLETAIILIAIVVAAAVLGFTVLSSGLFAAEKGAESTFEGLKAIDKTVFLKGKLTVSSSLVDTDGGRVGDVTTITTISFGLSTRSASGIDLTPPYQQHHSQRRLLASGAVNSLILSFSSSSLTIPDSAWTAVFVGDNDGDNLLENGETVLITAWLFDYDYHPLAGNYFELGTGGSDPFIDDLASSVAPLEKFSLQVLSEGAGALVVERTLPAIFDPVMQLD